MNGQPQFCYDGRLGFNCRAGMSQPDGVYHHFRCPEAAKPLFCGDGLVGRGRRPPTVPGGRVVHHPDCPEVSVHAAKEEP